MTVLEDATLPHAAAARTAAAQQSGSAATGDAARRHATFRVVEVDAIQQVAAHLVSTHPGWGVDALRGLVTR